MQNILTEPALNESVSETGLTRIIVRKKVLAT